MEPTRDPEGREIEHLAATGVLHGRRVLEVGCGDGRLTRRYAPLAAAVTAFDPDFERLCTAAADPPPTAPPAHFLQARAENLPYQDGAFYTAFFSWSF